MATQDDVRRAALALPDTVEADDRFAFSVQNKGKAKGIAWVWLERIHPKKARVPNPEVVAIRVEDEAEKQALLAEDGDKFFTEPHYNGFRAVLVRLSEVKVGELRALLEEARRCMAPSEKPKPKTRAPKRRTR
jgi:hypothetical protein